MLPRNNRIPFWVCSKSSQLSKVSSWWFRCHTKITAGSFVGAEVRQVLYLGLKPIAPPLQGVSSKLHVRKHYENLLDVLQSQYQITTMKALNTLL